MKKHQVSRLTELLKYIDEHLDQPLNLALLSEASNWSRWQIQRVFQLAYEQSLMSYVRQRRLSDAATQLLNTTHAIQHIALSVGYDSQAVFTRTFRDHFHMSPSEYRATGKQVGIVPTFVAPSINNDHPLDVRIKAIPSFTLAGMKTTFNSVHSPNSNNQEALYNLWTAVRTYFHKNNIVPGHFYSLVDISTAINSHNDGITYWAGVKDQGEFNLDGLQTIVVPAQNYASFFHRGKLETFKNTMLEFLLEWIPNSNYCCIDGVDLEVHPYNQAPISDDNFEIEILLPVAERGSELETQRLGGEQGADLKSQS